MADDQPLKVFTRRDLLKGAALAGAAAVAAPTILSTQSDAAPAAGQAAQAMAASAPVVFENLTAAEGDLLEAVVARLIPSDALGPGAKEARAARYIDRALGGALASSRQAYAVGLAALDSYARVSRGRPFLDLPPADQDAVLTDIEAGSAATFTGGSRPFFAMVLAHTRQGTFGDPFYGGNANFVGWDLLQYPGVRTMVTAADQQTMEKGQLKPNHKSAYDSEGFNKATVSRHSEGGDHAD